MKNIMLIIAASFTFLMSFSQNQIDDVFSLYEFKDDRTAHAYEKIYYYSEKDGKPVTFFWGDYNKEGIDLIVEEANRILLIFDTDKDKLFKRDDFLLDGMFDSGEGDGNSYKVTFSDGSYMKVGAFDAGEFNAEWGHLKVMEVYFKQNHK